MFIEVFAVSRWMERDLPWALTLPLGTPLLLLSFCAQHSSPLQMGKNDGQKSFLLGI